MRREHAELQKKKKAKAEAEQENKDLSMVQSMNKSGFGSPSKGGVGFYDRS